MREREKSKNRGKLFKQEAIISRHGVEFLGGKKKVKWEIYHLQEVIQLENLFLMFA